MIETAYAKINLALHVRARRDDGHHELETLFAFVDTGDTVAAVSAAQDSLKTVGEFARQLAHPMENIVLRALSALPRPQGWAVTLEKNLPIAAGLGGGSADAGAIFRLAERSYRLPADWQQRAAQLGADVPACVRSVTAIGRGTGADLTEVDNDLNGMPILLVNPRVPLSTGPVFKAWDGVDRGALPGGPVSLIARQGRNDLATPAIALCPAVATVLAVLSNTRAWLVRMSGSGATCFALFEDFALRDEAAERLASHHPGWWQLSGTLR